MMTKEQLDALRTQLNKVIADFDLAAAGGVPIEAQGDLQEAYDFIVKANGRLWRASTKVK
jgi:hypothetical protein